MMEKYVEAIELSLSNQNWYSALALALTLPDICGWLEDPHARSQKRYEAWFDRYMLKHYQNEFFGPGFTFLSGSDCYALRCAYLHEGNDDITRQRARQALSRFSFKGAGSHRVKVDDLLHLSVTAFCGEVCSGVRDWVAANTTNPTIQERLREQLMIHENGVQVAPGIFVE